jgi:hypothetical protein
VADHRTLGGSSSAGPAHPLALVFPTLPADTASHVRSVGAVLEVSSAGVVKAASSLVDHSSSVQ